MATSRKGGSVSSSQTGWGLTKGGDADSVMSSQTDGAGTPLPTVVAIPLPIRLVFKVTDVVVDVDTMDQATIVFRRAAMVPTCVGAMALPSLTVLLLIDGFSHRSVAVYALLAAANGLCAVVLLAMGKRSTDRFIAWVAALSLYLGVIFMALLSPLVADVNGENLTLVGLAISFVGTSFLSPFASLPIIFLAVICYIIRMSLGSDMIDWVEQPVSPWFVIVATSMSFVFVGSVLLVAFQAANRQLLQLQIAIAERSQLRTKLQDIKLKTGFKENDSERVELAAERVVEILREFRVTLRRGTPDRRRLGTCIDLIASNRLYDVSTKKVKDTATANWLDDMLEVEKKGNARLNMDPASLPGSTDGASIDFAAELEPKVVAAMKDLSSWSYDVWALADVTEQKPLRALVDRIVDIKGLYGKLKIDRPTMGKFLHAVQDGYLAENPYHNAVHGADVAHGIFWLLEFSTVRNFVAPIDQLACVIAAAVHDVKHPGVNNNFLARTMHPLALQYNDKAILENMHASEGMKLAFSDEHNIFRSLSEADRKHMRKYIIEMILATDMTRHFELINLFKTSFSSGPPVGEMKEDEHLTMLRLAMKMADVSNPAKPVAIAVKWTMRIVEEFFSQGDKERAAGLDISPFMDRTNTPIPKTQVGFISFMVHPMWTTFNSIFPVDEPIRCLEETKAHWERENEKAEP